MMRLPLTLPHFGAQQSGYAVLLIEPTTGFGVRGCITTRRTAAIRHTIVGPAWTTSLSPSLSVRLDTWAEWLNRQGVSHSGVNEVREPNPYATVVFRDPDNVQLEFIHLPT